MTIQAYQTLYESSIAYGMRKALMAEQKKNEMQTNITQLRQACEESENEVTRLEQELVDIVAKDEEDNKREQKAHEDQVDYLKALNQDYKSELEQLLSSNKQWEVISGICNKTWLMLQSLLQALMLAIKCKTAKWSMKMIAFAFSLFEDVWK